MAQVTTLHPLIDGALSADFVTERAELVAKMAAILIRQNAYAVRADAIHVLRQLFSTFDVLACVDDAMMVATQHQVAMEMADV